MKQTTLILNNKIELKIESGTISCFGNVVLILKANVSLNLVLGMPAYKPKLQWRNIAASQTIRTEIIVLHYYKGICPQFQAMACQRAAARGNHDSNHWLASPFHGPPRESALSSADTCINTSLKCDIETFDF